MGGLVVAPVGQRSVRADGEGLAHRVAVDPGAGPVGPRELTAVPTGSAGLDCRRRVGIPRLAGRTDAGAVLGFSRCGEVATLQTVAAPSMPSAPGVTLFRLQLGQQ